MVSKEEIQNLAELARLQLNDTEAVSLQKDISNILEYVGQLSRVSEGGDKEKNMHAAPALRNVMREDVPRSDADSMNHKREALLAALPGREGDYAVVRKILQKDE
jgi:aspartyl/glutamyl-tRNA(Asn/Gln) amidotransferase C subunit